MLHKLQRGQQQITVKAFYLSIDNGVQVSNKAEVLTNVLKFSIHPKKISRPKVMASLESIFYYMTRDVSETNKVGEVRNDLPHLAKIYHSSYQASCSTSRKHRIFQRLKSTKDIVILRLGKGMMWLCSIGLITTVSCLI